MIYSEALEIAQKRYGNDVYVVRKPKNGFTATNPIPSFLGEITSLKGHNDSWWVYRTGKNSNRQIGDRPKTQKTIRIDTDLLEKVKKRSYSTGQSQTEIIESALKAYLG